MDELSKEYVLSYYSRLLRMYGDSPQALRWTPVGQIRHYECLLDIGDIRGSSILDYGCGKGDFYQFLRDRGIDLQYTGFDINPDLIETARRKFPECRFRVFDIEKDELDERFDYIFLCGVFNLRVDGVGQTIKRVLRELFRHCKKALAFNALSAHNPEKDFELNYLYPEEIFTFAVRDLSHFVSIRHDRIAYDFSMFVYKKLNVCSHNNLK
jgi:SAM-dependent methyltransferase